MKPHKSKDLFVPAAMKCDIPVEDVKNIVNTFYANIREALTEMKDYRVHVHGLGDFLTKHWLIDEYIEKYEKMLLVERTEGVRKMEIEKSTRKKIERLKYIKQRIQEEQQRKEFIQHHKVKMKINEKKA